ncbi:dephospho-CoA kinase [Chromatocurvus halotolerans]|uniref:Dephospho-CoA kinase n=1 Tax=Chromatocurvus halotolerans TaxID=1132028 RepID=A0A4R2KY03_9GAMM|nr:dephospho-CoA kinase [Chromatocurvus halotolerans]TCO76186.1 dephospho-CoA kinase [Chromatocurvus halotolerans]
MFVVGITGGIGSGKSAVTSRLAAKGIDIVDADIAARTVVEPGTPGLAAIAAHFGDAILQEDGSLNRAALRERVFSDPDQRHWLEQLTHPLIGEEIHRQLSTAQSPYAVLSSPLLLESSQHTLADCIVVVDVPEALQIARTMARDNNSEDLVRRIMAAQLPRDKRLEGADIIIDNSTPLDTLDERVNALHEDLLNRASSR